MQISHGDLLDRGPELASIERALDGARQGRGSLVTVESAAGTGKSALLIAAGEMAATRGMRVLAARAGELEQRRSFGVIRQLFGPVLTAASGDARRQLFGGAAAPAARVLGVASYGDASQVAGFAAMQSIYWLSSQLALSQPLVGIVDDAHWADSSSLRTLDFLTRRIADLPLVLLVAFRPEEPEAGTDLLDALRDAADVRLAPAALSRDAVASIVRSRLSEAGNELCDAFLVATAGNPLYVNELLRAVHLNSEPLQPRDVAATPVRSLGDRVLRRIERVDPMAPALARAMAILGDGTRLAAAAALATLSAEQASTIAHHLRRIEVLSSEDPVSFVHPLIKTSIDDAIPEAERQTAHRDAAALLQQAGAPAEDIAAHLGRLIPAGNTEVAEALASAAGSAIDRAAPEEAIAWLQRAREERALHPTPFELLVQLGSAQATLRDPTAADTLEEAYRCAPDVRQRVAVGILLAELLAQAGAWKRARDLTETLGRDVDKRTAAVTELAAVRAAVTLYDPDLIADFDQRREEYERLARGKHWGSYALSALLGASAGLRGQPREALAHAERARADGRLLAQHGGGWASPQLLNGFILSDELDAAARACDEVEAAAGASGSIFGLVTAIIYRGWLDARRGELINAEVALETALAVAQETGMLMILTTAAFLLIDVVLERSLPQIVDIVEQTELPPDFLATTSGAMLLETRGRLRMARNDHNAIADLRAAGEINGPMRFGPPWSLWRSSLALALPRTDRDTAHRLAADELALARSTGLPRSIGIALRTLGVLRDVNEGIDLLHESVLVLEGSPGRLERARSLVELGAALRRANHRRDAREPLAAGLRLAHSCGAQGLAEQADHELRACGGRRPRLVTTGRDALTASELRVAERAGAGATNPEIAQQLYVSVKTIETHLSHAYDKLGLAGPGSRAKLTKALTIEQE
ncbi:MAG TPA: AAA family ATPase [Solirubrobacteraceae bacterium]|jgi:DNA-binding CsgD family transcriptional regulator